MKLLVGMFVPEDDKDFSGPEKKNGLALLQEESDTDAGEVFLLVFWGQDAIRPYLDGNMLREPRDLPELEQILSESGIPPQGVREPLLVGGSIGMELGFLCGEEQDDDAFEEILVAAGQLKVPAGLLLLFCSYREGQNDEMLVFAYTDDQGVEHLYYFADTETATRVVASATALTSGDRDIVLEVILRTILPESSRETLHFMGFAASYIRGMIQTVRFLEVEPEDEDPDVLDPEDGPVEDLPGIVGDDWN